MAATSHRPDDTATLERTGQSCAEDALDHVNDAQGVNGMEAHVLHNTRPGVDSVGEWIVQLGEAHGVPQPELRRGLNLLAAAIQWNAREFHSEAQAAGVLEAIASSPVAIRRLRVEYGKDLDVLRAIRRGDRVDPLALVESSNRVRDLVTCTPPSVLTDPMTRRVLRGPRHDVILSMLGLLDDGSLS